MRDLITTLIDIAAVGLLVVGVALIYVPAAFITAGVAIGLLSWNATRPVKTGAHREPVQSSSS